MGLESDFEPDVENLPYGQKGSEAVGVDRGKKTEENGEEEKEELPFEPGSSEWLFINKRWN